MNSKNNNKLCTMNDGMRTILHVNTEEHGCSTSNVVRRRLIRVCLKTLHLKGYF